MADSDRMENVETKKHKNYPLTKGHNAIQVGVIKKKGSKCQKK